MEKTRRKYRKEIILLIIVLFICFITFELIIRIIKWPVPMKNDYPIGMTRLDPTKGHSLTPNFKGYFPTTNISISINSKGLRDYGHDYANSKNKTRILALGDSVTFGAGVDYSENFIAILEDMLNNTLDVEIIKAGVGGYEFSQEYNYYKEEGHKYDPDIVIIGLVLNDIMNPNITQIKRNFEIYGNDMKKDSKERTFIKRFCHSCVFAYSVIFNYNKIYSDIIYYKWEDNKQFESYSLEVSRFNNELSKKNISLVIIVFPYTWQFDNFNGRFKKDYLPQKRIKDLASKENINFIDLSSYLDRPDYKEYYLPYDNVHLNTKGNKLAAEIIYNEFIRKDIIK